MTTTHDPTKEKADPPTPPGQRYFSNDQEPIEQQEKDTTALRETTAKQRSLHSIAVALLATRGFDRIAS